MKIRLWRVLLLVSCTACSSVDSRPPAPPAVERIPEAIQVTAWAEPSRLPAGGGDCQILVRVLRRGDGPIPGVEVRLVASQGTLYSGGKTLLTDTRGMTRDRVRTRKTTLVTLNAGGTPYTLRIGVGETSRN